MTMERIEKTNHLRHLTWEELEDWAGAIIAQRGSATNASAAGFLRKLGWLLEQQGRADDWQHYLAGLREANKRKRRLLAILDRLSEQV